MTFQKEHMRRLMNNFRKSRFRYLEIKDGDFLVKAVRKRDASRPAAGTGPSTLCVSTADPNEDGVEKADALTVPKPSIPSADERSIPKAQAVTPSTLRSPRVGHFYLSGKGLDEPALVPGAEVEEGQLIGYIESMNIRHEVKSDKSGIVEETLVEDGEAVEYGQALARLKETAEAS